MHNIFRLTKNNTIEKIIIEEPIDNEIDYTEFIQIIKNDSNLTNGLDTYYNSAKCKNILKEIHGDDYENESLCETFFIEYYWTENLNVNFGYLIYNHLTKTPFIMTYDTVNYITCRILLNIAHKLEMNLYCENKNLLITDDYLETLRINEENKGIKLTKKQSHVLSSVEEQCRWFYVPTEDVQAVLPILGIQPELKEAQLTDIINDVQFENKIVVASFTGHTILFGLNAPYIAYPNLNAYVDAKDQHTPQLQNTLNKLSKTFGTAAYFEYNNDDEMIASLAWSSKGKFVYGRFTSEGEGFDVFGTQKKVMEVNQKTLLKTAKKLGMTPEDILTGIMKQNQKVQYFTQCDWNIESKLEQ